METSRNLRDFHTSVARRLASPDGAPPLSRVGVVIGQDHWLVNLQDIIEVVAVPRPTGVPHTCAWFIGIANVRGNLYGIIDTPLFFGGLPADLQADSRVLLAHPRFSVNAGLIVSCMLGLRDPSNWSECELDQNAPGWISRQYCDNEGRPWKELDMGTLLSHPDFLHVARQRWA